ncbi:potassium-transporting ATPase subunit KdpA [Brevibacterium sp. 5221]|uniref:Potassium-transporting ATPase potassium-binding subunit n=1 Tax=Brevibacterium rongguiense TaxID=2695267 RepID=A0A6N9HA06_9MICO|nr:potassium-transporting ATPase subunit KdpA [Brevibacterium rongguiense]MYM20586.1 potassium-transporting ATPase subunit KdpA [Brevibacterium rongguiense]
MKDLLQIAAVLAVLAALHRPLGAYMARLLTSRRDTTVERLIYRAVRVAPRAGQPWRVYLRDVLTFSAVSIVALTLLQSIQGWLPLGRGAGPVHLDQAINTAVSFTTNTNWQSYSGETAVTQLTQMLGLAVQNFVSAAVGIAVVAAFIRGLAARRTGRSASGGAPPLGNFWVDLTRISLRLLLPIAAVGAVLLILGGAIQNFHGPQTITTLDGSQQTIPGGLVASQESIKVLGTNGGGYFNANSAHPFENPAEWTNLLQVALILLIPSALPRTFGIMVGDRRQGWSVLGAMAVLFLASLAATVWAETALTGDAKLAGASLEGRELRFGTVASAFFATATTLTSTGAVDSFHSSYSGLGGGVLMFNMLLGEIAPGGVGSGLYGMLVIAILSVFICGLMIGRTPEYLGKKIGPPEIRLVAGYVLVVPACVLLGTGASLLVPGVREAILNPGPHGLSEVLYAFTSASNNNGSAFAGLGADTPYLNLALAAAMALGRFVPIAFVLALAGRLAGQTPAPPTSGTLPTHRPLFAGVMVGCALIVTGLTYLPALALGPLAEGLS